MNTFEKIKKAKALKEEISTLQQQVEKSKKIWSHLDHFFKKTGWENRPSETPIQRTEKFYGRKDADLCALVDLLENTQVSTVSGNIIASAECHFFGIDDNSGQDFHKTLSCVRSGSGILVHITSTYTEDDVEEYRYYKAGILPERDILFQQELKVEELKREFNNLMESRFVRHFVK